MCCSPEVGTLVDRTGGSESQQHSANCGLTMVTDLARARDLRLNFKSMYLRRTTPLHMTLQLTLIPEQTARAVMDDLNLPSLCLMIASASNAKKFLSSASLLASPSSMPGFRTMVLCPRRSKVNPKTGISTHLLTWSHHHSTHIRTHAH